MCECFYHIHVLHLVCDLHALHSSLPKAEIAVMVFWTLHMTERRGHGLIVPAWILH